MKKIILFLFVFLSVINLSAQIDKIQIIPQPQKISNIDGKPFQLNGYLLIINNSFKNQKGFIEKYFAENKFSKNLIFARKENKIYGIYPLLKIEKDDNFLKGKYEIVFKNQLCLLKAGDVQSVMSGIQTLRQIFNNKNLIKISTLYINASVINDYPRFNYRGLHLDVSRHFFDISFIKKYLEYMSYHKLNTFHWHLTDDQGWRIPIAGWPKLTSIGAYRNETLIGHYRDTPVRYDGKKYGGFYTIKEIKEVIKFASYLGIDIVPEIDIPGHSRAVIAAYPELSTEPDTNYAVGTTWGFVNKSNNVLAPNDKTFKFLKDVFEQVANIFPSKYLHLGGDECSKMWWKKSDDVKLFMNNNNIKDEFELQTHFINYVSKVVQAKRKSVIGWDEILEGELAKETIIMSWRGEKGGIAAAKKGMQIVMSPGQPLYFDHYQTQDPNDSLAIHGYNPLDAVYNYNPIPKVLDSLNIGNKVLGAQANVWTEYMASESKVEYMIFPRLAALSEVLWSKLEGKDYNNFLTRLENIAIPQYKLWGVNYCNTYRYWTIDKKKK